MFIAEPYINKKKRLSIRQLKLIKSFAYFISHKHNIK